MAEISSEGKGGGKGRSKKVSTKVDMTPMVDLAFLLITFFMLTTTLANKKRVMNVQIPQKVDNASQKQKVPESRTVNVILASNDKIYWYEDPKKPELKQTNYSEEGIREVFRNKQNAVDSMIVIIKPMPEASYRNLVDIMDEVKITSKKPFYSIAEITPEDKQIVAEIEGK